VTGSLTLDSDKTFGVSSTVTGVNATKTGYLLGASGASQLQAVSTLDVSSVDAATRTLSTVDSALSAVAGQRAKYGALQSRFDTTIANLQVATENASAARSRTQDADFAPRRPTCRVPRSCNRLVPPWWRRPTSCRKACWPCCVDSSQDKPPRTKGCRRFAKRRRVLRACRLLTFGNPGLFGVYGQAGHTIIMC